MRTQPLPAAAPEAALGADAPCLDAAQWQAIVEAAMDAIVTVDARQRVRQFNRAAEQLFGVPVQEALGSELGRFLPARHRAAHGRHVQAFACEGATVRRMGPMPVPLMALHADGEEFPIEATISRAGHGAEVLMTVVIRDDRARQEMHSARRAEAAAHAARQAQGDFVRRMGHELRTPLHAVMGFAQLLQAQEPLRPRQELHVQHILAAGRHLQALIDDMLDLEAAQGGKIAIRDEPVPLAEVAQESADLLQPEAAQRGAVLHPLRAEPDLPPARGDALRVRQVVMNLITNAVKYGRPGGPVRLLLARGKAPDTLCLRVLDEGQGIPPAQLAHLFQPFNRLGREHSGIEGSGIGLALSRELVRRMGGELTLHSLEGLGTCAELVLPCRPAGDAVPPPRTATADAPGAAPTAAVAVSVAAPAGPAKAPVAAAAPSRRVLYVEDNPVNYQIVEQLLAACPGVALHRAASVAEALRALPELVPDVLLLDLNLPDGSGLDVLRAVHAVPPRADGPPPPVVLILSADAQPEERERALRSGASDYWVKPLDLPALRARLRALLADLPAGPRLAFSAPAPA